MTTSLLVATLMLALPAQRQTPTIEIGKRAEITSSVKIKRGTYLRPKQEPYDVLKDAVVVVKGNDITVDFNGAVLRGSPETAEPNQRTGTGIFVEGKNITIKNARVHGYHVGLQARNSSGLKIVDCDFSYNWKQHLASTLEREDLSDWMSFHHNDNDEWITGSEKAGVPAYGGAIYLANCDNFEISGTKAQGGQCGLMMTRSTKGKVWNNDFSFLSALGIGMYRSSENTIMHNKIDWCVRGFSLGVYNRGQDSAGILMFEQCMKNVIAYNSVTHGGDGFFLWAGQTTMDTGEGGCNDNLLYGNDFSHAPTNGIEATFSRNNFVNNLVLECWHGVWGGYSYDSKVIGNVFGHNAEAIAWEHGQNNLVERNEFIADNEGVYLWSNPTQDPNWGYAKKRDTRSRDWKVTNNWFTDEVVSALHVRRTEGVQFKDNIIVRAGTVVKNDGDVTGLVDTPNTITPGTPAPPSSSLNQGQIESTEAYLARFDVPWSPFGGYGGTGGQDPNSIPIMQRMTASQPYGPARMKDGMNPFLKKGELRGWRYMMVDEWGPYDFKRPILWPRGPVAAASSVSVDATGKQTGPSATTTHRFEILGPKGKWKVANLQGVGSISKQSGTVPDVVDITLPAGKAANIKVELEYTGAATTDYRGIVTPAGKPVRFSYEKFFAPIDWVVNFFRWTEATDPRTKPEAFAKLIQGDAEAMHKTDRLDYASGGSFVRAAPTDNFATVADGTFEITPGTYILEVTMDDGARVWLDGKPVALKDTEGKVAETWKYQGPTLYTAELYLTAGKHKFHVEHFEINGYAALKLALRPKK
jgi:hypothetical protein